MSPPRSTSRLDEPRAQRARVGVGWPWALSLALHVAAVAVGGSWALRSFGHDPSREIASPSEHLVALDLPVMAEKSLMPETAKDTPVDPIGERPRLSSGPTVPRVDTGHDGRGGDESVESPATHLSDRDEHLRLSQGTMSRLDRDETQRVRSDTTRAAWEDRRSTTHPMELAFLSSGELARLERRAAAERDPSRGVLVSTRASLAGGRVGSAETAGDDTSGTLGGVHAGSEASAPGRGVKDGAPGMDHRLEAAVAHARPDVALAPVSVEAPVKGRARDNVDSEQEVAAKVESLVHASTAGGAALGKGVGGSSGGGQAGALGVTGAGSHPTPLGDNASDSFDVDSTDPRIIDYLRRFKAKLQPLWANAFPKSALLELKQGTVILELTITADGTAHVAWPPLRPSGIDEFDRNCAEAVRKGSPFGPLPSTLGVTSIHIRAPFVASNPIVH